MMRLLQTLVLCLLAAPLIAQETEQPLKTTLCQIKADPISFNKKLVEVSGYASHGFEDSMFEDPKCFWGNKLPGIWMEYGGTASTDTMYCCGFSPSNSRKEPLVIQGVPISLVHDESFERLDKLLHAGKERDVTVRATVVARIFAQREKINGRSLIMGYGHMGCCMLLVIQKVESVESTEPERSIFEMAHDFEKSRKKTADALPPSSAPKPQDSPNRLKGSDGWGDVGRIGIFATLRMTALG